MTSSDYREAIRSDVGGEAWYKVYKIWFYLYN